MSDTPQVIQLIRAEAKRHADLALGFWKQDLTDRCVTERAQADLLEELANTIEEKPCLD